LVNIIIFHKILYKKVLYDYILINYRKLDYFLIMQELLINKGKKYNYQNLGITNISVQVRKPKNVSAMRCLFHIYLL